MSTTDAILLPGAEDTWTPATADVRAAVHAEFQRISTDLATIGDGLEARVCVPTRKEA